MAEVFESSRPRGRSESGNGRGPRIGTQGGGGGYRPPARPRKKSSDSCWDSIAVAIPLTLFYALPRLAFDSWRARRG